MAFSGKTREGRPMARKEVIKMTKRKLAFLLLDTVDDMRKAILEVVFPVSPPQPYWCNCSKCGKWHRANS